MFDVDLLVVAGGIITGENPVTPSLMQRRGNTANIDRQILMVSFYWSCVVRDKRR
jgi:hypothetical protein